jgi:hypothetical protein
MYKKVALAVLLLVMVPAFAFAGSYSITVVGSNGTVTPGGAYANSGTFASGTRTFSIAATTPGYTIDHVQRTLPSPSTDASVLTPSAISYAGSGPWTLTITAQTAGQAFQVSFKKATTTPLVLLASAPASLGLLANTATTLSGATTTIQYLAAGTQVNFAWTGPAGMSFNPASGSVTTPAGITTQVTSSVSGTATLTLSAPGNTLAAGDVLTATTAITIQLPGVLASSNCLQCHMGSVEANAYALSPHANTTVATCQACHNPGVLLQHPGYAVHDTTANPGLFYSCITCHTPGNTYGLPWPPTGLTFHNAYTGTNQCTQCHDPHSTAFNGHLPYPHFSTFSTAQYVTRNISCVNCHTSAVNNSFNIYSANYQWAKSGKGNPKSPAYIGPGPYTEANLEAYDFKFLGTPLPAKPATTTSQDCVRCHTTTGYVNYVNSNFTDIHAWGTPGDRTREMIACNACHNNTTGFDATFSRRSVGIETDPIFNAGVYNVAAWYGYSSAATKKIIRAKAFENPTGLNMNDSNICIVCHAGTAAGDLIKLSSNCASAPSIACKAGATGSFWSNVNFIDPHNMNSANFMFPDGLRSGYEYLAGTSYSPDHTNIGLDTTQGPCVGCHMSSPNKHSFSVISTASNGTIAAITTNVCTTCHGTAMDAPTLQTKMTGYQAALAVIAAQLAAKGIYYNAAQAPYFFTTAVPAQQTVANRTVNWYYSPTIQGANLMGAAFNLRLMQTDAGWVHNSTYAKRLLYDTIHYLDDGQHTTVSDAINSVNGVSLSTQSNAILYMGNRP